MDDNNEITYFGLTSFRNQQRRFGIKPDDRRRHFYTIGKTGMGKSNLMENMAIQDIQEGRGVAYIDPHGEGAEKLLDFVPASRINDVIFFNPADLDFPIAFNVMEKVDFRYRHLVAGGLMAVFKKIWPDVWSARMEYILSNSILALLEYPDSTLLGTNRMLADPEYRAKVVAKVKDPMVKSFWTVEFARYTQRYEIEATAAIQNKIGQFISNPLIRNIIGQTKSTINMRKIMDERKIFIMDLSKGRIGEENSRLLGQLLVTRLQLAAMSRVDTPEAERQDFYLYVDEFQNFATESFASILSEARKYRLNLIIGHQYINQMEEVVRDAVFGNVGTLVVFRVGAEDAEFLEREFSPEFTAEDLVNLAKYNVYLKLMIDGVASHPFSAITLPPPKPLEESNREKIIRSSRERYGIAKEIVEEKILRWSGLEIEGDEENNIEKKDNPENSGPRQGGRLSLPQKGRLSLPSDVPQNFAEPQALHNAVCSICGRNTKVIFQPESGKPVYCKSCLKKIKAGTLSKTGQAISRPTEASSLSFPRPASPANRGEKRESAPVRNIDPRFRGDANSRTSERLSEQRREDKKQQEPEKPAKIETIAFHSPKSRQASEEKPKRKEINLSELKKALEESLEKKFEQKPDSKKPDKSPAGHFDGPATIPPPARNAAHGVAGGKADLGGKLDLSQKEIPAPAEEKLIPAVNPDDNQKNDERKNRGKIDPGQIVKF